MGSKSVKGKKRGFLARQSYKDNERYLPVHIDEYVVFNIMEELLTTIEKDGVNSDEYGNALVKGNNGEWMSAGGVMAGWLYTWMLVNRNLKAKLILTNLISMEKSLRNNTLIELSTVVLAKDELMAIRVYFRTMPRESLSTIACTAKYNLSTMQENPYLEASLWTENHFKKLFDNHVLPGTISN